jgi:hypothetical protein
MRTTVENAIGFDAVADNAATAMRARWRKRVNRALEAVEHVRATLMPDLERFVVVVSAHFTFSHESSSPGAAGSGDLSYGLARNLRQVLPAARGSRGDKGALFQPR